MKDIKNMVKFVVYSKYGEYSRAPIYKRIHITKCRYAKAPNQANWEGPFDSFEDADHFANRIWVGRPVLWCKHCIPEQYSESGV